VSAPNPKAKVRQPGTANESVPVETVPRWNVEQTQ